MSDIQDHLITMTQNLNHYEKILSRSHSNYLAQISIEMTDANNQINDVLSKLTALGTVLIPMNLVTGEFSLLFVNFVMWSTIGSVGITVFVPGCWGICCACVFVDRGFTWFLGFFFGRGGVVGRMTPSAGIQFSLHDPSSSPFRNNHPLPPFSSPCFSFSSDSDPRSNLCLSTNQKKLTPYILFSFLQVYGV